MASASEVMRTVREQNLQAMDIIRDAGVRMVPPDPARKAFYRERLNQFVEKAVERGACPEELREQVQAHIRAYRGMHPDSETEDR